MALKRCSLSLSFGVLGIEPGVLFFFLLGKHSTELHSPALKEKCLFSANSIQTNLMLYIAWSTLYSRHV
jgi:hypothetical protein